MNNLKTGLLLIALTLLLVWIGGLLGGQGGMLIAFGFAIVMNVGAYWWSDKMVLRMYRAQEIAEVDDPELYGVIADLAQRAQLPMPRVYRIPSPALNAFATGRNPAHAAVAITDGLRSMLDRSELMAVMGHELSHVRHRDILIGTVAATIAGAVSMLGSMARWGAIFGGYGRDNDSGGGNILVVLVVSMLAGLAAMLVQTAISRSREFEADAGSARLLGDPQPMIAALRKLEAGAEQIPMQANPATAHMMIISPLRGRNRGVMAKFFSTHPSTDDRIARLQSLVGQLHR
ncbi:MAG: zinc metalloprotease HtpX [Myxococcota bacterium]